MDRKKEVEQIVTSFLPKEEGYQKTVLEAMNYSVSAGGKRLRPMLMLETYRMFGGTSKVIEPFMAAIEMNTVVEERRRMWYMVRQWRS